MMNVMIRDEKGEVYNKVENPAVVFDNSSGVLHKIGEFVAMQDYFNQAQKAYRDNGFHSMANELTLMELPNDQEVIDKVFQNTGYIGTFYKEVTASLN